MTTQAKWRSSAQHVEPRRIGVEESDHGVKDIVVQPINAFIFAQHLPDAHLIMYPDASHGAQYQHAGLFLQHAKLFLSEGGPTS